MHIAPGQGLTAPWGRNNRKALSLYPFVDSFNEISLMSDFIHFFFHDLIHVYSPSAGGIQPPGDKVLSGWLGRAMVLGSFQCRGGLLLSHMVGQGPAVLAAGAGQVGCFYVVVFFFFISSILSSFSNASSVGTAGHSEILWSRLLSPSGSCQLLPEACSLSTG